MIEALKVLFITGKRRILQIPQDKGGVIHMLTFDLVFGGRKDRKACLNLHRVHLIPTIRKGKLVPIYKADKLSVMLDLGLKKTEYKLSLLLRGAYALFGDNIPNQGVHFFRPVQPLVDNHRVRLSVLPAMFHFCIPKLRTEHGVNRFPLHDIPELYPHMPGAPRCRG